MPWIREKELEWLFKHSFYPALIDEKKGKKTYRFGCVLPKRKSISAAIRDAMNCEANKEIKK